MSKGVKSYVDYNTLVSDLKKANKYPKKEYMLNKVITNIIQHIYMSDINYIKSIKNKFKNTVN